MASKSHRTAKKPSKRGTNPASLANLQAHKFAPGQSGNPGGRPKLLGESYKAMLARVNESDPQHRTNAELIAEALKISALKGDVSAAREIRAATESAKMELTGAGGGPVEIRDIESVRDARWAQIAPMLAAAAADPEENESE